MSPALADPRQLYLTRHIHKTTLPPWPALPILLPEGAKANNSRNLLTRERRGKENHWRANGCRLNILRPVGSFSPVHCWHAGFQGLVRGRPVSRAHCNIPYHTPAAHAACQHPSPVCTCFITTFPLPLFSPQYHYFPRFNHDRSAARPPHTRTLPFTKRSSVPHQGRSQTPGACAETA